MNQGDCMTSIKFTIPDVWLVKNLPKVYKNSSHGIHVYLLKIQVL